MAAVATIVSYRLGGTDGVSVEAAKWAWALSELGFTVRRVAGQIEGTRNADDVELPALAIAPAPASGGSSGAASAVAVRAALSGSDLVVVENIASLPLNVDAARAVSAALESHPGRVLLRHHDLPWQRRHLAALGTEFPPRDARFLHVTINLRSMRELASRGIDAVALHNRFEFDAAPGDRARTRAAHGFADDELVFLQPTRAIERKNVPGAVRYLRELAERMPNARIRYWLTGPAEDGYDGTLERVLRQCPVPVTRGRVASTDDAYAASDVVLFPSTWEGFGNPTIESIRARRPLVAFPYPVLAEIAAFGIRFFSTDAPDDLVRYLARPDEGRLDLNLHRARVAFDLSELPAALEQLFAARGWSDW
jgi:glycosyltransferase involved in cell wall biosynthesis